MNTETKQTIFMIGGTGYIGGSILHLMTERGYLGKYDITVLVRRTADLDLLTSLGVRAVLGSIDDSLLLEAEAAKADIVISNANCDHQRSIMAIINGLTLREEKTGKRSILIHTSGAGVLSSNSYGLGLNLEEDFRAGIWDDVDFEAHLAIPNNAPHRHVDLEVLKAAKQGQVKTYLVIPPTVFGKGLGIFGEKRMSIQIPRLIYYSLQSGKVMNVGTGENQWTNVHVADLADLYLRIIDGAVQDLAPEGLKGIYYPSSEYFQWSKVSNEIAKLLKQEGYINSDLVTSGLPKGWFWGSNVRMKTTNGRMLGWSPSNGGPKEMLEDLKWDLYLVTSMA